MRKLFVSITLLFSVLTGISSAQAEMVRCRTSPNGWCNAVPAPGYIVRPARRPHHRPAPAFVLRAGPVSLVAPAPVRQTQTYAATGGYYRSESYAAVSAPASTPAQSSGEARCTTPDSKFVAELGRCIRSIAGNSAEAQQVSPDIAQGDPMCKDKPPGFKYDKNVVGPNGEQGIDHRVCGRRPN